MIRGFFELMGPSSRGRLNGGRGRWNAIEAEELLRFFQQVLHLVILPQFTLYILFDPISWRRTHLENNNKKSLVCLHETWYEMFIQVFLTIHIEEELNNF